MVLTISHVHNWVYNIFGSRSLHLQLTSSNWISVVASNPAEYTIKYVLVYYHIRKGFFCPWDWNYRYSWYHVPAFLNPSKNALAIVGGINIWLCKHERNILTWFVWHAKEFFMKGFFMGGLLCSYQKLQYKIVGGFQFTAVSYIRIKNRMSEYICTHLYSTWIAWSGCMAIPLWHSRTLKRLYIVRRKNLDHDVCLPSIYDTFKGF